MPPTNPALDRIFHPRAAVALAGLLLAAGAALSFLPYREPPVVPTVEFTLISSDREDVACLGAEIIAGFRCGFGPDGVALSLDEAKRLQPFQTLDRRTFLVPGLFRQPAVEERIRHELRSTPRETRERFTVRCRLEEVGRYDGFLLRWLAGSAWSTPQTALVASVSDCEIMD